MTAPPVAAIYAQEAPVRRAERMVGLLLEDYALAEHELDAVERRIADRLAALSEAIGRYMRSAPTERIETATGVATLAAGVVSVEISADAWEAQS